MAQENKKTPWDDIWIVYAGVLFVLIVFGFTQCAKCTHDYDPLQFRAGTVGTNNQKQ